MQYLVITNDTTNIDWTTQKDILVDEAKVVWENMCSGKLRNIWLTDENNDAILLFEANNNKEVISIMESLPLVKEKLINYKIIGLTTYKGFERLFTNK